MASLCLFLIDEDEPVKPRRVDVFEMGVPRGGRKRKTWWSIAAVPPGVEAREPPAVEKALSILCSLLKLKMYMGWKVVQLSTVSVAGSNHESYIERSHPMSADDLSLNCASPVMAPGFPMELLCTQREHREAGGDAGRRGDSDQHRQHRVLASDSA